MSTSRIPNGVFSGLLVLLLLSGCGWAANENGGEEAELLIQPGPQVKGGVNFGNKVVNTLTLGDAEAIDRICRPVVACAAPIVRVRTQAIHGNQKWVPHLIYGTRPQYFDVRQWKLAEGEIWTEADTRRSAEVCVLGQTLVKELFDGEPAMGKVVLIDDCRLRVIGILAPKGSNLMGLDQDDIVLAPLTTIYYKVAARTKPGEQDGVPQPAHNIAVDQISARTRSLADSPDAIGQITDLLRKRHRIGPHQPDDFNIRDKGEMIKALNSINDSETDLKLSGVITVAVVVVALIAGSIVLIICRRRRVAKSQ